MIKCVECHLLGQTERGERSQSGSGGVWMVVYVGDFGLCFVLGGVCGGELILGVDVFRPHFPCGGGMLSPTLSSLTHPSRPFAYLSVPHPLAPLFQTRAYLIALCASFPFLLACFGNGVTCLGGCTHLWGVCL